MLRLLSSAKPDFGCARWRSASTIPLCRDYAATFALGCAGKAGTNVIFWKLGDLVRPVWPGSKWDGRCRVEGTQSPPLIEPDGRIYRIRLSEIVHRNGYRVHATAVGIFQS